MMKAKAVRLTCIVILVLLLLILTATAVIGDPSTGADEDPPAHEDGTRWVCLALVSGTALLAGGVWLKALSRLSAQPRAD
jgi:drug/metabolite transporter (DMT)-like permease